MSTETKNSSTPRANALKANSIAKKATTPTKTTPNRTSSTAKASAQTQSRKKSSQQKQHRVKNLSTRRTDNSNKHKISSRNKNSPHKNARKKPQTPQSGMKPAVPREEANIHSRVISPNILKTSEKIGRPVNASPRKTDSSNRLHEQGLNRNKAKDHQKTEISTKKSPKKLKNVGVIKYASQSKSPRSRTWVNRAPSPSQEDKQLRNKDSRTPNSNHKSSTVLSLPERKGSKNKQTSSAKTPDDSPIPQTTVNMSHGALPQRKIRHQIIESNGKTSDNVNKDQKTPARFKEVKSTGSNSDTSPNLTHRKNTKSKTNSQGKSIVETENNTASAKQKSRKDGLQVVAKKMPGAQKRVDTSKQRQTSPTQNIKSPITSTAVLNRHAIAFQTMTHHLRRNSKSSSQQSRKIDKHLQQQTEQPERQQQGILTSKNSAKKSREHKQTAQRHKQKQKSIQSGRSVKKSLSNDKISTKKSPQAPNQTKKTKQKKHIKKSSPNKALKDKLKQESPQSSSNKSSKPSKHAEKSANKNEQCSSPYQGSSKPSKQSRESAKINTQSVAAEKKSAQMSKQVSHAKNRKMKAKQSSQNEGSARLLKLALTSTKRNITQPTMKSKPLAPSKQTSNSKESNTKKLPLSEGSAESSKSVQQPTNTNADQPLFSGEAVQSQLNQTPTAGTTKVEPSPLNEISEKISTSSKGLRVLSKQASHTLPKNAKHSSLNKSSSKQWKQKDSDTDTKVECLSPQRDSPKPSEQSLQSKKSVPKQASQQKDSSKTSNALLTSTTLDSEQMLSNELSHEQLVQSTPRQEQSLLNNVSSEQLQNTQTNVTMKDCQHVTTASPYTTLNPLERLVVQRWLQQLRDPVCDFFLVLRYCVYIRSFERNTMIATHRHEVY